MSIGPGKAADKTAWGALKPSPAALLVPLLRDGLSEAIYGHRAQALVVVKLAGLGTKIPGWPGVPHDGGGLRAYGAEVCVALIPLGQPSSGVAQRCGGGGGSRGRGSVLLLQALAVGEHVWGERGCQLHGVIEARLCAAPFDAGDH